MAKINLNRQPMPKQPLESRKNNFDEVALGYTPEQALEEASRCLQCPKPPCVAGCPVGIDIPDFIKALREHDMPEATHILKRKNSLPGICGRVCPQESQCEKSCVLAKKGAPVAIGRLERYVADWERSHPELVRKQGAHIDHHGKKIAIVGSGPAGLSCSAQLAQMGYEVTIFEALHSAGGVLTYGIPSFRLPKDIVQGEIDYVKSLGVEIQLDQVIGKISTVDDILKNGYAAVFLAPGAGAPMFLNIPGENLNGIYSANEFLTRINLMKAYLFPEYDTPIKTGNRVAVIGGGNVAMDAARCAVRLGAEKVYIIYRRSRTEMPARQEERENAEEEGVIFTLLTNPKRFIGDDRGKLTAIELYKMKLGEHDDTGRRRPITIPESEFTIDIDTAIVALGTKPNPLIPSSTTDLDLTRWGSVKTDAATGRTSKDSVWCGGDMATGAATVISAMGAGKIAATSIDSYLKNTG
ncbi:MAG: NADPH-dependent glutamate synthase [Dehalococcoidia bacterium]|nr:NADPH-dependent glutamate synthase [Dehalococcoidia bacterium]